MRSAKGVGWHSSLGTADFLEGVTKEYGACEGAGVDIGGGGGL